MDGRRNQKKLHFFIYALKIQYSTSVRTRSKNVTYEKARIIIIPSRLQYILYSIKLNVENVVVVVVVAIVCTTFYYYTPRLHFL